MHCASVLIRPGHSAVPFCYKNTTPKNSLLKSYEWAACAQRWTGLLASSCEVFVKPISLLLRPDIG